MIKDIGGSIRNRVFLVLLAATVSIIIVWWNMAGERDKHYIEDYRKYVQASQLLNQNKTEEAEPILAYLSERYSDSYLVLWMYGLSLSENNKLPQGAVYMQRAREMRPALLMNPNFLVQYGDILYRMGDYIRAERYLAESKKYNQDAELAQKSDSLLQRIKLIKK